ncbi:ketopantoate reductase family protein [Metabacillus litoralis]|jgi:2-dehydropantoate 2-reductase|uniref:ketopantoate reductase family protein n=1 Tax=Metabacillus litoralis TaxID=152268 RepID=UPI002041FE0E|nr:ketopantoate reductase family protein [Metabacillus litoralis]MCM3651732.1 ketopantoate reductase family protein [Metabacillus litoralis]
MKKIEKVSIIGLGAIGAAYASKIYESDSKSLQIIADSERIERYKSEGFNVNGNHYEFNYITPEENTEPADLILVAVKYSGLQQAIKDMKKHVGPQTIILSLMNGIASEEMIAATYGDENLLYGMCVAIDAVRERNTIQFSGIGKICFGEELNTTHSPNVQLVKEFFEQVKIPYEIPENMLRTMWWKFMINVGVNQTSAVLRGNYQVFQEVPKARQLMIDAMQEVVTLSEKVGINLTSKDIDEFLVILDALSPQGKTSMLQDIEAGRKTEVEYLAGKVSELGQHYLIPTPINDMLLNLINIIEQAALVNKGK